MRWLGLALMFFFIAVILYRAAEWLTIRYEPPCSKRIEVYCGTFSSNDFSRGQRASLQRLAREVSRCPQAEVFIISRHRAWLASEDIDRDRTFYDRKQHVLYDGNIWAGDVEQWDHVTDADILTVARSSGNFKDLAHFGCKSITP